MSDKIKFKRREYRTLNGFIYKIDFTKGRGGPWNIARIVDECKLGDEIGGGTMYHYECGRYDKLAKAVRNRSLKHECKEYFTVDGDLIELHFAENCFKQRFIAGIFEFFAPRIWEDGSYASGSWVAHYECKGFKKLLKNELKQSKRALR